jgi:hypothetical protein
MKRTQMNLSRISDDWYELRETVIYYTVTIGQIYHAEQY